MGKLVKFAAAGLLVYGYGKFSQLVGYLQGAADVIVQTQPEKFVYSKNGFKFTLTKE